MTETITPTKDLLPDVDHARAEAIARLNDDMRRKPRGPGKRLVVTRGVNELGPLVLIQALRQVAAFSDFKDGNNPFGERDFGEVSVGDVKIWFKIDYYDADMDGGSPDPTDPAQTVRVMTLLLPDEY